MKISLKAARVNAGLSQKQVGKELKVSNKTVCSWENGKTFPDAQQITALCELYKVNIDNLNFLPSSSLRVNERQNI